MKFDDHTTVDESVAQKYQTISGYSCQAKRAFLNRRCSLLPGHQEIVEVDLATLWVMRVTLEVVELIFVMVATWGKNRLWRLVTAQEIMEEVTAYSMDLQVKVVTKVMVLVIVAEEVMVMVEQDMETKVIDMVEEENVMVTMEEEEILEITVVVVELQWL